jgi:hypothetical protein
MPQAHCIDHPLESAVVSGLTWRRPKFVSGVNQTPPVIAKVSGLGRPTGRFGIDRFSKIVGGAYKIPDRKRKAS